MFWYGILAAIDKIFFTLVRDCFKIVLYLADVEIFEESVIKDFSSRVYMLLAVVMFFKIAVSTIQYLVDPEKLSDSNSGAASIIKNAAIAILLLVIVPEVFRFARSAQSDVAGYIPALIMGDEYQDTGTNDNVTRVTRQANNMTTTVMKVFYSPKSDHSTFNGGREIRGTNGGQDGIKYFFETQVKSGCHEFKITKLGEYFDTSYCSWNYTIILPVVVATLMIFVLISMGIDIAIRAIKFALLEIMAPIPIVSYIDKAGKGAFETWVKEVKDVYIDLFIRIAVIYFMIFIIDKVVNNFNVGNMFKHMNGETTLVKGLVLIFIIIGLLLFAKTAPKYLCDALGIKGTDKISPMFKRAGGLLGAAGSGLTAGYANIANARRNLTANGKWAGLSGRDKLRETLKAAASGVAGTSSGLFRGGRSALSGKGLKESFSTGHKGAVTARQNRDLDKIKGVSMGDRFGSRYADFLGLDTASSLANNQVKAADQIVSDSGALKGKYMELMDRYASAININHAAAARAQFKSLISSIDPHGNGALLGASSLLSEDMKDIVRRLNDGQKVSYAEVTTLKNILKNDEKYKGDVKIQQFAEELDTSREPMKNITAEFMKESMSGSVDYMSDDVPATSRVFERGKAGFDKDLEVKITTEEQHIAENAAALSGVMGANGPEDLIAAFHSNFKSFEGGAKAKGNKARTTLSADKEALARESTQRRKANNEKK